MLRAENLSKSFGDIQAVKAMDFSVEDGEFVTIVGPSGCGKSTTLRMLAGHIEPSSGTITLNGEDITFVPPQDRPTCLVFQKWALFPHMTVRKNIGFPVEVRGEESSEIVDDLLSLVKLDKDVYAGKKPDELSQGQQQRVALARSLAYEPDVLLLDEPLANLDYLLRKRLQRDLADLNRKLGTTFIYVTHSLETALLMSDRIFVMKEGQFVQQGTPENIYLQPANRFVAEFMGDANLIDVTVEGRGGNKIQIASPDFEEPIWISNNTESGTNPSHIAIRYGDAIVKPKLASDFGFPVDIRNILMQGNQGIIETDSIEMEHEFIAEMDRDEIKQSGIKPGQAGYFQWNDKDTIVIPNGENV